MKYDMDRFSRASTKDLICIYCGKSQADIQRQTRRNNGSRIPCYDRGTPKGWHKYYWKSEEGTK